MDYFKELQAALASIPSDKIATLLKLIKSCIQLEKDIYVIGNGGSASISDHFCCDFNKGSLTHPSKSLSRAFSLANNPALVSALNNDIGLVNIFSWQIDRFVKAGDIVIVISSSGTSQNIENALKACLSKSISTFVLTGMTGGSLVSLTPNNIKINSSNYGIVEDCHMSILHMVSQVVNNY